ncbi:inner membrane-spanning protein YciB [Brevundimonas balnearis]|uniref:Inner membrane-spanning protein YciB n=1 Tax=Brevundimonas balnearis TaxID=1572858 RepID=A0ABV6R3E6_9CAUL
MSGTTDAKRSIRQAVDFGALLAFLAAYVINRFGRGLDGQEALVQATWVLVAASAVALIVGWLVERRLAPLPLLSGGFALIFGGLTLLFNDPTLLKVKLSIQNGLLAAVLLGSLPFRRYPFKYLLESAFRLTEAGWRGLTLRYGLYFAAVAVVNEIVWRTQSDDVWVSFRGGLWLASAAFGIWQVVYIMKHMIKDDDAPAPENPDTGL